MAVTILGIIQHRRGIKADLPVKLEEGELGFCVDTRELFIGNTPAQGGNTQIFTDAVDVVTLAQYQFLSDTQVTSQTGTSMNQPIIRSLQAQLDDAWVNVKAYGAKGDGITDDTVAINRAIEDLYTKQLTTSENVRQARKTVWFPAGRYLVTDTILLYPEVHLQGENYQNTQLFQALHSPSKLCLLRLTDSLGQTGAALGDNSAQLPMNQSVCDLNLHVQNATQIVLLERPNQIEFCNCWFSSAWVGPTVTPGTEVTGVTIQSLGTFVYGDVWLNNCKFTNMEWAMYCDQHIQNIHILNTSFNNLYLGVITSGSPGPLHVKVQNCVFDLIEQQAIKVMSTSHVSSLHNTYLDVNGGGASILWALTTSICSSVNDQFENIPSITDLGTNNLILNAQQNNLTSTDSLSSQQVDVTTTSTNAVHYVAILANASGINTVQTAALLSFNPSTNQLGIGTATPTYNLHVVGNARVTGDLITASRYRNIRVPTGITPYTDTMQAADDVIVIRTATDTVQVNLPVGINGRTLVIKDGENNASVNNITIQPIGSDAVGTGAAGASYVINTNSGSVTLIFDGVLNIWHLI